MNAELITRFRNIAADGSGIEMVVWKMPESVPPSNHCYKYRLVFLAGGIRVVGFDNERGKGDHQHLSEVELPYQFFDVETLFADFITEVEKWKNAG